MINREYSGGVSLSRTSTARTPPSLAPGPGTTLPIQGGKGRSVLDALAARLARQPGVSTAVTRTTARSRSDGTVRWDTRDSLGLLVQQRVDHSIPGRRFAYASRRSPESATKALRSRASGWPAR